MKCNRRVKTTFKQSSLISGWLCVFSCSQRLWQPSSGVLRKFLLHIGKRGSKLISKRRYITGFSFAFSIVKEGHIANIKTYVHYVLIFVMPTPAERGSAASRELDLSFLRTPSPLPTTALPSVGDVIRYARFLQEEAGQDRVDANGQVIKGRNYRNFPLSEIVDTVARDVLAFWSGLVSQFSYPIIPEIKNIKQKIKTLLERAKITSERLEGKEKVIQKLFSESGDLFDILSCR